ncbi:MAG: hypothetical protein U9Q30_04255 [Campylobacterota bacterium]|nr:hypothetical protein [Campylobacterota bacterium]
MIDRSGTMLYHINNLNVQNERVSYQMATGKVLDKGSDDAVLHSTVINIEDKLRVTEGLMTQIEKSKALNDTADDTMSETKLSLENVKLDLMKALNSGVDRTDKLAIATNLEGIRDNIIDRVNTEIDGEYIFAGSVTTNRTLVKDADFDTNGKVEFGGDSFLREIAVQPGSYRDRGITAYDAIFYNASTATAGTEFTWSEGDRVIDEYNHEWKVLDGNGAIYDPNDTSATPSSLQKYDHNGVIMDTVLYPESNIAIDSFNPQVESNGDLAVKATFTINTLPTQPEGRLFEAKHNYLDDLNVAINALKGNYTKLDGSRGIVATDAQVTDILKTSLTSTTNQYDATNVGHGELGGRNHVFDVSYEKLRTQEIHYNMLLVENDSADLAKLAMESKSLEMTYQSLYSTISKMNNLTLLDYIK